MAIVIEQRPWARQPSSAFAISARAFQYRPSLFCIFSSPSSRINNQAVVFAAGSESAWGTGASGVCIVHPQIYSRTTVLSAAEANILLPTTDITVLVHMRKTDTTARASYLFGTQGMVDADRLQAHMPYSDNNCYFDFGAVGTNRISVAETNLGECRWGLTSGGINRLMVRNGRTLATLGAIGAARTAASKALRLGDFDEAGNAGDLVEYYAFCVFNRQMPQTLLEEITRSNADFYSFLCAPLQRRIYFPSVAAPAAGGVGHRIIGDGWGGRIIGGA